MLVLGLVFSDEYFLPSVPKLIDHFQKLQGVTKFVENCNSDGGWGGGVESAGPLLQMQNQVFIYNYFSILAFVSLF